MLVMSNESRLHSLLMDHYINIHDQATHFNKGIFVIRLHILVLGYIRSWF